MRNIRDYIKLPTTFPFKWNNSLKQEMNYGSNYQDSRYRSSKVRKRLKNSKMIFEGSSQKGRKGSEERLKKSKENMNVRLRDAINVMDLRVLSSNTSNLNILNSTTQKVKEINLKDNMKKNRWTDHFTFQHFLLNLFLNEIKPFFSTLIF